MATVQWLVIFILVVLAIIAAFVLKNGAGSTTGGGLFGT